MNLSGLPFSLGFFIKHFLFVAMNSNSLFFYFIFINCLFGALTGLFYSFRLFFNVFFDFKKARYSVYSHYIENSMNSFFYSNSSLASNIAISFLFFISYFISMYILIIYSSNIFIFSDFFFFKQLNSFFFNFNPSFDFLNNFSYTNFFTVAFMFFIAFAR